MTWPKPDKPIIPRINKPKILNWLVGFFLYVFVGFSIVWFNRNSGWLRASLIGYLVLFCVIFIVALAYRIYYYFIVMKILSKRYAEDIQSFHENWQNWANQSIAVLDSYFFTPNSIEVNNLSTIDTEQGNVLTFSQPPYAELLSKLQNVLSQLPQLKLLKITFISNQDIIEQRIMLERLLDKLSVALNPQFRFVYFNDEQLICQLVEEDTETLTLIIVSNLHDLHSSEFMGYFLLAPETLVNHQAIQPKIKAYLLRTLLSNDIDTAISQLIEMQPIVSETKDILATHWVHTQETMVLLLQKLSEHSKDLPQQLNLDWCIGEPSALSYWLSLHLACDLAQERQSAELVISQLSDKTFFNMVVSDRINN